MHQNKGKCTCGKTEFILELPEKLEQYSPRQCDCDFCVQHKLMYLSHPQGKISISTSGNFEILKQGSEQASFLSCNGCGDIIGAFFQFEETLKGAVNSNLLNDSANLQRPAPISPKVLKPNEKVERWNSLWLQVSINGKNNL